MGHEIRDDQQVSKEVNGQKVWETPALETHQAAEEIQNTAALPAGDTLVVGS